MSRHQHDLDLINYDLRLFRSLFFFFLALDSHWPCSTSHCMNEDFLPLAKNVVWPLLNQKHWVGQELESIRQTTPISEILLKLDSKLSETFRNVI